MGFCLLGRSGRVLSFLKPQILLSAAHRTGTTVHICHFSSTEMETGRLGVQGQPGLPALSVTVLLSGWLSSCQDDCPVCMTPDCPVRMTLHCLPVGMTLAAS